MTLSPDGKWLWNGEDWIPAPPKASPSAMEEAKEAIREIAQKHGLNVEDLTKIVENFDLDENGSIDANEIEKAAQSVEEKPEKPPPNHRPSRTVSSQKYIANQDKKREKQLKQTKMICGILAVVIIWFIAIHPINGNFLDITHLDRAMWECSSGSASSSGFSELDDYLADLNDQSTDLCKQGKADSTMVVLLGILGLVFLGLYLHTRKYVDADESNTVKIGDYGPVSSVSKAHSDNSRDKKPVRKPSVSNSKEDKKPVRKPSVSNSKKEMPEWNNTHFILILTVFLMLIFIQFVPMFTLIDSTGNRTEERYSMASIYICPENGPVSSEYCYGNMKDQIVVINSLLLLSAGIISMFIRSKKFE